MVPNPALGVVFHWLGGLASGSFYVPFRRVRRWSWETYWLVGGFFSWIIAPWVLGSIMTNDLVGVLRESSASSIAWAYIFGVLWGTGGLTFGLTMRYLGMSLGMAVALGYCAAFGTLMPPIFSGEFGSKVLGTESGIVILSGVGVCLLGIALAGIAGMSKEREMPEAAEARRHPRVQSQEGLAGRDLLRHHERLFLLRACGRRLHPRSHPAPRALRRYGRACPCWSSSCSADSPRTSSGASR